MPAPTLSAISYAFSVNDDDAGAVVGSVSATGSGTNDLATHARPYVLGELTIDHAERLVTVAGRLAPVTPTEYLLLELR